jgi:hypothetical protein
MAKKPQEEYSEKEAAERLAAALRGARMVGHKPMKDIPPKRKASGKKPRKHRD